MAAAEADFTPAESLDGKIKKAGRDGVELSLTATTDVLSALSARRTAGQMLVGFAAEHGPDAAELASSKLTAKGLDLLVVNDISDPQIGFESSANEVTIISATAAQHVAKADKLTIAGRILDAVDALPAGSLAGGS
uniref:Unannotated protein n=1 Tax=freshwater metagenome TaxID=449393 RepID=A0A6J5Z009_9ZZZZ